jgi:proteasome lid subunit RPN8/RPN11
LSTPFQLTVPRAIYEEMIAQARSELPNECCGLLAGRRQESDDGGQESEVVKEAPSMIVERRYAMVNAALSPTEYLSDPRSMFDAVRDMRRHEIEIVAVYHSHPTSAPVPSLTDLERNYSPDVMNLIISLKDGLPHMRAWWLTDNGFHEADWRFSD